MFFVLGVSGFSTVSEAVENAIFSTSSYNGAYFGYCEYRVTFCLLARLAGTPKLGLAPLPNPLRVGHTTIIVG